MSMDAELNTDASKKSPLPAWLGWIAMVLTEVWAVFLHQGLAPPPGGFASEWWHPTQYLLLNVTVSGWAEVPALGTAVLGGPAVLLTVVVFLSMRSAVLRTWQLAIMLTCLIFAYAGFGIEAGWQFFHWRLSLVFLWTSGVLATCMVAPRLSEAWLRRSTAMKLLIYVPIAFGAIALIRNATGTDETLFGNFSPWPVIPLIGLEIGAYAIVGLLVGLALGLWGVLGLQKNKPLGVLGIVAGVALTPLWLLARFDTTGVGALVVLGIGTAIALGMCAVTRNGERRRVLARRAGTFALGATLIAVPIFTGRAWANADYTVNKFVRAKIATDALAAYFTKEGIYPEDLETLIEQGYLDEIPKPRVGFDTFYDLGLLAPIQFSYRPLGSSYVLEFVSTEWVQCAYNPPWVLDEGEEPDPEDEAQEAWSCPDTRPALWGDDVGREGEEEEYVDPWADDEDEYEYDE